MDTPQNPSNISHPGEQPNGQTPEQFKAPVAAENSFSGGATNNAGAPTAPVPQLSADDVRATIAAAPTPLPTAAPTNPVSAADVDVIEPEWVDKAEHVIQEHAGDPHAEEEAIEDLQQDYLSKRYGYTVDDADPKPANNGKAEGA